MSKATQWPIALIEDRYSGVYSGGKWIAVEQANQLLDGIHTRAQFCLVAETGPSGDDTGAAVFWSDTPNWVAVGPTPSDALDAIRSRVNSGLNN